MATASILPPPRAVFFDSNGNLLAGGSVATYIPGTTTAKQTWQDAAETIPNTQPVILDSNGSALILGSGGYSFAVTDQLGNAIPEYSGVTQAPGYVSDALLPVVGAATLAAAETALGISPAMQPVVAATTLIAARNLLGNVWVTPFSFGGIGDGVADDTTAIQTAMNSLTKGGTLYLPSGYSWKTGSLTVPVGVTLLGPFFAGPGAPGMANLTPPYGALSSLRLTVGATITIAGGGGLSGLFIAPFGMTFQQTTTASFAGTAITGTGDDIVVEKCLIMGFAQGFTATNVSRVRVRDCNMDCLAGISIVGSTDVCHLDDVHLWPFATIGVGLPANLQRSGIGFNISGANDDTKVIGCFAYGYATGFNVTASIGVQYIGCCADNNATGSGIGFSVVGADTDTTLIGCQATGQTIGFNLTDTGAGLSTRLVNCDAWGNTIHGMLIDASALGDVTIMGGMVRNVPNGITVASATCKVDIIGVRFEAITGPTAVNLVILSQNVRIDPSCNFGTNGSGTTGTAIGTNLGLVAIASATSVPLPPTIGPVVAITGTTNITSLSGGWTGRQVTLLFAGAGLTVASNFTGVTSQMRLSGNANFTAVIGSTLSLAHNGTQWFETGRSA